MTGTWRDTLFIWRGPLSETSWSGTWVGVEECPDATKATTPTTASFLDSKMQFSVTMADTATFIKSQWGTKGRKKISVKEGWDLEGDGQVDRHTDDRHELYFGFDSGADEPDDEDKKKDFGSALMAHLKDKKNSRIVVAAVGDNAFGYFVSAGHVELGDDENTLILTLARRYLDGGDERSKWKVEDLYAKLDVASDEPWITADLHAVKAAKKKRKR